MSSLPPLSALRAFEAVARNLSFSRAAEELGMSQAAISYQIKVLEDRVGKLFHRRHRHIELTETGRLLAPGVRQAFQQLSEAFAHAVSDRTEVLSMTVVPTFASQWLAQQIGTFQMAHPDIAVRIEAGTALEDLSSGRFDLAIRSGPGGWPGMRATRLLPVEFTPMVSSAALDRFGPLSSPGIWRTFHCSTPATRGGASGSTRSAFAARLPRAGPRRWAPSIWRRWPRWQGMGRQSCRPSSTGRSRPMAA